MVQKNFCDRCGAELQKVLANEDMFSDFLNSNSLLDLDENSKLMIHSVEAEINKGVLFRKKLQKPELCKNCMKLYNNIIDKTNKEISVFMKEGKKETKKKFRLFG